MPLSPSRLATALLLAGVLVAAATGCTPVSDGEALPTPSSSAGTETETPSEPEAPTNPGTPIDLTCEALVSPQAMYDYNPNFALDASFTPDPGTQAAQILDYKGLACGWVNETSGEIISVAVANLPSDMLTELGNNLVSTSNSVPTYGVEGYFQMQGNVGEAEAFSAPYWIVSTSTYFFEPGDAEPIIAAALAGLGQ